ncbi:hypothetical protein [Syntrophaceticus schinkii]|uniref:Uncharacterized protein n=1 Tax=Syntrophaceticus schinkii TaxID=499207 RepID=A0A0B7MK74_9FIRM|nr:hypothetical protein [Syntrophaceticus schinkii]CEO90435.1 hypothetical protein SSCH_880006 [Syntrophaceticus schinkii]
MNLKTFLEEVRMDCQEDELSKEDDLADKYDDETCALLDYMIDYLAECSDLFLDMADLEGELIEYMFKDEPVEVSKDSYDKFMNCITRESSTRKVCEEPLLDFAVSFRKSQEASEDDDEKAQKAILEVLEELDQE